MANPVRVRRLEALIKREVGALLLSEMKDPRIGMVSVTAVRVSKDLRSARIKVSVFGEEKDKKQTMSALRRAQGFVQSHLARTCDLRITPEVIFDLDESIEKSIRVSRLIDQAVAQDRALAEERGELDEEGHVVEKEGEEGNVEGE